MTAKHDDSYAELKLELTEIVRTEIGFNELFAGQVAEALVRGMSKRMRGRSIYIPSTPYIATRNIEIRRRHDGTNMDDLCREYGISKQTFYRIIGER